MLILQVFNILQKGIEDGHFDPTVIAVLTLISILMHYTPFPSLLRKPTSREGETLLHRAAADVDEISLHICHSDSIEIWIEMPFHGRWPHFTSKSSALTTTRGTPGISSNPTSYLLDGWANVAVIAVSKTKPGSKFTSMYSKTSEENHFEMPVSRI